MSIPPSFEQTPLSDAQNRPPTRAPKMQLTDLLTLMVTATLVQADTDGTVPETGFGPGPDDTAVFRQAGLSPNATGTVNIDATEMDAQVDGAPSTTWRAHLNITEVTNLNYTHTSSSTEVITNSILGIDTLGGWVENSNWDTDIIVFLDVARNATVDGQKDEGDCYATLGKTCVQEYTTLISGSIFAVKGSNESANYTPIIPSPPASCKYRLSSTGITSRT